MSADESFAKINAVSAMMTQAFLAAGLPVDPSLETRIKQCFVVEEETAMGDVGPAEFRAKLIVLGSPTDLFSGSVSIRSEHVLLDWKKFVSLVADTVPAAVAMRAQPWLAPFLIVQVLRKIRTAETMAASEIEAALVYLIYVEGLAGRTISTGNGRRSLNDFASKQGLHSVDDSEFNKLIAQLTRLKMIRKKQDGTLVVADRIKLPRI